MFLQNYYWFKKSHPIFKSTAESGDLFPFLIEHMYKECIHNLRPKLKLYKSYEKAQEGIEKLRQQMYPNLGNEGENDNKSLCTIIENESDYTSEAIVESDDEIKPPRTENEDDFPEDNNDDDLDLDENSQMDDTKSQENKEPEKTEEDLEFEAMFDKLAADSYQERIKELPKVTTRDIPVPISTKTVKKTYDQLQVSKNLNLKKSLDI